MLKVCKNSSIIENDIEDYHQNSINFNQNDQEENWEYKNNSFFKPICNKQLFYQNLYHNFIPQTNSNFSEFNFYSNENTAYSDFPENNFSNSIKRENSFSELKYYNCNFITHPPINEPNIYDENTIFYQSAVDSKNESMNLSNSGESSSISDTTIFINNDPKNSFTIFNQGNKDGPEGQLIKSILENKVTVPLPKRSISRRNRKLYKDDVRKKIKARFLKSLKNTLNKRLKLAGSKYLFNYLSQNFIINVTKKMNRDNLYLTFKEIFSKNFSKDKDKTIQKNLKKLRQNISVINYLEKNEIISQKSNYKYYKDKKYHEIYDEYLNSKEFEEDIIKLKNEVEDEEYINRYIKIALNLNKFFTEGD
jgi:hypothetical protein